MDHDRAAMKVASLLLQYPDERLRQMIGGVWSEIEDVAFADFREYLRFVLLTG